MQVSVKQTSASERVLTVRIPADRVEEAYRQAFEERRKGLKLKGFRKGNVPVKIARKHISDAQLVRQVVNLLVPAAYREAVTREKLQPLGKPEWKLKQSERGSDLVFEAMVHVMPILELDGHKKLRIERPAVSVSSEQVEQILQRRRQGVARYLDLPSKHKAREGDFCFIDYSVEHPQKKLPNSEVNNFLLELKEDKFLPGFTRKLVGAKSGQELEFDLRLPENYAHQQLAGEKVRFRVKIHQLKERRLPDLDDAFAREHCNAQDLAQLKERVRRNLESQQRKQVEDEIVNEIVSNLASAIDLDVVPPPLREGHARLALRTQTQSLERQGLTLEKWLAGRGISMEHFGEELNLTGLVEARLEILYRSLAADLDISVTNKEVDQAIINQAKTTRTPAKELKRRMIQEDTYKLLAYRLLIGKIRSRLLELAEVRYLDDSSGPGVAQKSIYKKKKAASMTKKRSPSKRKSGGKKSEKKKSKSKEKTSGSKTKTTNTGSKKKTAAKKKDKKAKKKKSVSKKKRTSK